MPFITWHLPVLNTLPFEWHWTVAEGAAMNMKCTSWCRPQKPRHSNDGTVAYLEEIARHKRVTVITRSSWDGKVAMCNACLANVVDPCVLLQMDADELWTADQLGTLLQFFEAYPGLNCARFYCQYFLGQNIVSTGQDSYGNNPGEWLRAWRYTPGMRFERHEPPVMGGMKEISATREQTKECDLVFQHYAYAFLKQVEFKQEFYGYKDAVKHWLRLQQNTRWPVKLQEFLPWVDANATADLCVR